tara:strand:- start:20695 stop:22932 length:2238 start_codon:yes stop_codon:yes gene_type:complete
LEKYYMIKNYIIGSGYLSNELKKELPNSKIYTAKAFLEEIKITNESKKKINLIINSFYSSRKLNNFYSYRIFVEKSLLETAMILDKINPKIIKKILYTSSSSVYGSINDKIKVLDQNNRYIYSSIKLSCETLLKNFSNKSNIDLDICRVFNLYGNDDSFSIISKLKAISRNQNEKITIYNNGKSIRDFIHVNDVSKIYRKLLLKKGSGIIDIGSGKGLRIIDLINSLKISKNKIIFKKSFTNEISNSIADPKKLFKKIGFFKFRSIEKFFKINKKLVYHSTISQNLIENNLPGSIIYGAGYSGTILSKQLIDYRVEKISYFVDDDPKKIGKDVSGVKIISFDELKKLSHKTNIKNIIIAIPSLSNTKKNKLIKKLLPISSSISSLPEKSFYKLKKINFTDLSEIPLDELFNKKKSDLKLPTLKNFNNKNILVTGGAGSIGSEISRQLLNYNPKKIIILDHSEYNIYRFSKKITNKKIKLILGDIKDNDLIANIISINKINYIFHAAAYKHVKFLEDNIFSAVKNNIYGTHSILKAIKGKKIKFIFISTDKAVKPKNILGLTKRTGELLVHFTFLKKDYQKSKYFIVRFGNVIGSDGSALPYFLDQIKKDLPIQLTDKKMRRYFMSIKEACNLVLQCSNLKSKNSIFFLDMGKPIKIFDIIKKMFDTYSRPDQKLRIKILGNKFNEKISEKLTLDNKIKKTKIKKIFYIQDKFPKQFFFDNYYKKIISTKNSIYLSKLLKKIVSIK